MSFLTTGQLFSSTSAHAQLVEPRRDLGPVGARVDLFQYVEDRAVGVDDEGPPLGIGPALVDHTIRRGDFLVGVTQNRIVQIEARGESPVRFGRVTAGGKEGNIEAVEARPGGRRKVDLFSTFELDDE
jgi:hypothetical protein